MTQFVQFIRLQNGTEVAEFDTKSSDGPFPLNQKSLTDRIANGKRQDLDTSVEELVLAELRRRNEFTGRIKS